MIEGYKIGDNLQSYVDKGCRVKIRTEYTFDSDFKAIKEQHGLTLINNAGQELIHTSANNVEKGLSQLNKKLTEKVEKEKAKKQPLENLIYKINQLRELHFKNNDKAHHLSRAATFKGWDVLVWGNGKVEVKIHNAGNTVLWFDCLQENYVINVNVLNVETFLSNNENKKFTELLGIIKEYLYTPLEIRKQERERE
ncbi:MULTISPECIES: hypothetical protein [unclassified Aerococcus]|uniref:hypothetical protein n=1 Tax=unclassified Aerococcus TaxID=2618060 RepID=UPI0025B810BE|nr:MULTISPECIES: hypothetical protein [unclassified Aerococcus]